MTELIITVRITRYGRMRVFALMILTVLVMSLSGALPASAEQTYTLSIRGTVRFDLAYQALEKINAERAKKGASSLVMDRDLMTIAIQRAYEVAVNFDHTRPDGRNCFQGFSYGTACAENLAIGQRSAEEVYQSWYESKAHHNTYLSTTYRSTGLACVVVDDCYLWAEVFDNGSPIFLSRPSNYETSRDIQITKSYKSPCITVLKWKSANLYDEFMPASAPSFKSGRSNGYNITLTWSGVPDASGYYLYRMDSSGKYRLIKTLSAGKATYTDKLPSSMSEGRYKLRAYRIVGSVLGRSEYSSALNVKVTTPTPDRVNFTSASRSKTSIRLKWSSTECEGYKLYRYDASTGKYKMFANVRSGVTQYTLKGLKSGTRYKFVIRAYNRTPSGAYVYGKISRVGNVTTKT